MPKHIASRHFAIEKGVRLMPYFQCRGSGLCFAHELDLAVHQRNSHIPLGRRLTTPPVEVLRRMREAYGRYGGEADLETEP
jgi:hypothetical protein